MNLFNFSVRSAIDVAFSLRYQKNEFLHCTFPLFPVCHSFAPVQYSLFVVLLIASSIEQVHLVLGGAVL